MSELRGKSTQLTLDGQEHEMAHVARARHPLTSAQREMLREMRTHGQLRALDAGVILHAHRTTGGCRPPEDGGPCCQYASSDGSDALKRLAARGLCKRATDGLYMPVSFRS